MSAPLSLNVADETARPYFLWEEEITVAEFRARLNSDDRVIHLNALGRLLREARFEDVWRFVTPQQVAEEWPHLQGRLGRRTDFWKFILDSWRDHGLLS